MRGSRCYPRVLKCTITGPQLGMVDTQRRCDESEDTNKEQCNSDYHWLHTATSGAAHQAPSDEGIAHLGSPLSEVGHITRTLHPTKRIRHLNFRRRRPALRLRTRSRPALQLRHRIHHLTIPTRPQHVATDTPRPAREDAPDPLRNVAASGLVFLGPRCVKNFRKTHSICVHCNMM